jgi:hypothetical protein
MARIAPLEERIARYERIIAMRGPDPEKPKMSYEDIGAQFDPPLSRERVRQIIEKPPARPGRPSAPGRTDVMRRKLAYWEDRLVNAKTPEQGDEAKQRIEHFSRVLAQGR